MSVDPIARGLAAKTRSDALGSVNTQSLVRAVRTLGVHTRAKATLAANDTPTIMPGVDWAVSTINGAAVASPTVGRSDARLSYLSGVPRYTNNGPAWAIDKFLFSRGGIGAARQTGGARVLAPAAGKREPGKG